MTTDIARSTDPYTSAVGAEDVTASGRRKTHCAALLAVIRDTPGLIRYEIAERVGLSEYETSKRLSDLKNEGRVFNGAARYAPSKRLQQTWWPVEIGGQLRFA